MLKKSQSISINTIIIAAIALAVLVVLFVIFTGRFKIFSEDVDKTSVNCQDACKIASYVYSSESICSSDQRDLITIRVKGKDCCCRTQ